MSEILLQSILEKLGMFEAQLKQISANKNEENQNQWFTKLATLHGDAKKILEKVLLHLEKINELKSKMEVLDKTLERPLKERTDHMNHLHKGVWITVVLFFASVFFLWQWMNTIEEKKQFKANDIKYRALNVTGDKALLKVLHHTDSLYDLGPEHMQQWVVQEEDQ